jgi:hypothetical protein
MIDLFGMRQKDPQEPSEPAAPAPADAAAPAHAPRGSHRLWAFLLVLDSIFVMVFGGVVASKVYHYWREPALATLPPPHHHPMKPAETAASPAPTPVKAVEPPKPAEAVKPAAKPEPAKTAARSDAPRPPKPSLLNDPPKPRSTPTPAAATAAAAAPSAAADGKTKAAPVVFKLKSPNAKNVQLVGAFIVRGGRKDMTQDDDGLWSVKLYLNPGQYRYFFAVDKKKTLDPENPQSDRGASLLTIP